MSPRSGIPNLAPKTGYTHRNLIAFGKSQPSLGTLRFSCVAQANAVPGMHKRIRHSNELPAYSSSMRIKCNTRGRNIGLWGASEPRSVVHLVVGTDLVVLRVYSLGSKAELMGCADPSRSVQQVPTRPQIKTCIMRSNRINSIRRYKPIQWVARKPIYTVGY
jgi:hypothetical protein